MEPIIKIEDLSVAYNLGKTNENWVLHDINLEIYPEEYVIFFGPSGCGKSTLLYTIAGLEFPTKGNVIVNGKNLKILTEKKLIDFHRSTIGMVFQAYYLISTLSVKDNILLPQLFAEIPLEQREKNAKSLMEKFGIAKLWDRKPSLLSGGQQQRVAIARALINNPLIVLADELVGNLDSKNAEIVMNLLENLNKEDAKTIIHVTHDPSNLNRANRVFYLKDGKIIREVRSQNRKMPAGVPKKEITELEKLAQLYPWLPESSLRAKLILNHLLLPYGIEDQRKIEAVIESFLFKKIDERELKQVLDQPIEKGGINLYTQTAQSLSKKIIPLAKEIEIMTEAEENYPQLTPLEDKTDELRGYLIDGYSGQLSFDQIKRLEEFLGQRIIGKIKKDELEKFLDLSFGKGGVGLNRRTAKRFAAEVELILMK